MAFKSNALVETKVLNGSTRWGTSMARARGSFGNNGRELSALFGNEIDSNARFAL